MFEPIAVVLGAVVLALVVIAAIYDRPEVLPLGAMNEHLPEKERRSHTRFRVEQCMRLRRVDQGGGS